MEKWSEWEKYLHLLCEVVGHKERHNSLRDYCSALVLPIERKSVERLAAYMDPMKVSQKHQSLHHFVADSPWRDDAILNQARQYFMQELNKKKEEYFLIVDDTAYPKKGKHSVGVARQYCGQLGKRENCQAAVTLSLATQSASMPIAYQLYLPQDWAEDEERRQRAGIPEEISFATKPEIALQQIRTALNENTPSGIVVADAAYGTETAWRDSLTALGLKYAVGIRPTASVWSENASPLEPTWSGIGRKPKLLRRAPGHEPLSVKQLAMSIPAQQYRNVQWREGTNKPLSSRFAALRVRPAHGDNATTLRDEEWLLIEWPKGESEPSKYWFSTLPADTTLERLVYVAKMRWRIERDYQELKQEFGLSHYEGRGWRGFHHHATLCIAAYTFLVVSRLKKESYKKNFPPEVPTLPENFQPRGRPQAPASRRDLDRHAALPLDT